MTEIILCGTSKWTRFLIEIDKSARTRNSFLPCQLLSLTLHEHHVGYGAFRTETILLLRQTPQKLVVAIEVASDDHEHIRAVNREILL